MRHARLIAGCGLALLTAGCGGAHHAAATSSSTTPATPPTSDGLPPLERYVYDRSKPLGLRDRGVVNKRYPIKIHDVSFASPGGGRVPGYLVVPPARGRRLPAAIYLHGSGGSRVDFVPEATWMAARGAVTLTLTSPFSRPGGSDLPKGVAGLRKEADETVQDVEEVRRAIDLLQARPDVDPKRIGLVGWSAGAKTAALVTSVEPRLQAVVMQSGGEQPLQDYVNAAPPALRPQVIALLAPIDPLRAVAVRHHARLLLQDGRQDEIVPHGALVAMANDASPPKDVRWYAAPHQPTNREIREEMAWLVRQLHVAGPPVKGAITGPS